MVPDGWAEDHVLPWLEGQTDADALRSTEAVLAGLEVAGKAIDADTLELTKARRYFDLRWVELLGPAKEGRPSSADDKLTTLLTYHTPMDRTRLRKLWPVIHEARAFIRTATDADQITRSALLQELCPVPGAHVGNNSGDNEWYTPREYIEAARALMGGIDLDPASSAEANAIIGAARFYTEADDGLSHDWNGRIWMNPPYQRPLIDAFCAKLAESYAQGDVTAACVLVNNATETGWFHALAEVAAAICFPRHRVKFWHPTKAKAAPLQGQAIVYLGDHAQAFRDRFVEFGFTVAV